MKRQESGGYAPCQPALSRFALTVLRRIKEGRRVRMGDSGDAMQGSVRIPQSVVKLLIGHQLVQEQNGVLTITEMGVNYIRRSEKRPSAGREGKAEAVIDPYRRQHLHPGREKRIDGDGRITRVLVNKAESPLGWLVRRKGRDGRPLIDRAQFEAGERLREDFEKAGLGSRVTAVYEGVPVSRTARGAPDAGYISDRRIDAGRRVTAAVDAMGPGLADVALRVCCHLEGLEAAEKALGWPARSGKIVLALALDRLVDFYQGRVLKRRTSEDVRQGEGPPSAP